MALEKIEASGIDGETDYSVTCIFLCIAIALLIEIVEKVLIYESFF